MALNHACNCCDQPPCAAPQLEFISVEASCEVCGFGLPDHVDLEPGEECLRFMTRQDTYAEDISYSGESEEGAGDTLVYENHKSQTDIREKLIDEEGDCVDRYVSGSYTFTESSIFTPPGEEAEPTGDTSFTESASAGSDGIFTGTYTSTDNIDPENNDTGPSTGIGPNDEHSPDEIWDYTSPGSYSKSFITNPGIPAAETTYTLTLVFSDPVAVCEPELPEWPAWEGESEDALLPGQGHETSASRESSGPCGLTLALRSIRWRLKHQPSGTCYLKVWIRKTFTPDDGPPTVTDLSPYVWTGTGNPCLADPALAVTHEDNLIIGDDAEETPPAANGVMSIEIVKFSCVEGYEPNIDDEENPQPNGFPDPLWEAAPP